MNDHQSQDPKNKLINAIIDTFKKKVNLEKWELVESNLKGDSTKKFIAILCSSCNGNINNIYRSFINIQQTKILEEINDIEAAISNLKEINRTYGKAYEKVSKEYENLRIDVENTERVLSEVEKECRDLYISNPQFQKRMGAFLKSQDKSEKNLQIILDDLTYLVDKLNRIMKYKQ